MPMYGYTTDEQRLIDQAKNPGPANLPGGIGHAPGTPYDFSGSNAKYAPQGQNIYGQQGIGGNWEGGKGWYTDSNPARPFAGETLFPEQMEANHAYGKAAQAYDAALANPTGTADLFSKYYQSAANALAAPAMRDFTNTLSGVTGNVAARFGGNASSEESRQAYNTADLFSRNLSESIAGLAPQAAAAGMAYTNMLGQATQQYASNRDRLASLILGGLTYQPAKQPGAGSAIGGALGGIAGAVLGGPAGAAAGVGIGSSAGGAFG